MRFCSLKTILYYITDHGLGHASRSVAIIRELQKSNIRVIIRNSNSINFLKSSLPGIEIIDGITDVGPIMTKNDSLIDKTKSNVAINNWIHGMDENLKKEKELILKLNPNLVISDISAVPIKASNLAKKRSLAISNFCWSDVLDFLDSEKLSKLTSFYETADLAIQLPFGSDMKPFKTKKKIGIVCRKPTRDKKTICNILKLNYDSYKIFVHLSDQYNFNIRNTFSTQIISTGAKVNTFSKQISPWIEGQDLISSSDLVICKLGYGMVSECLTTGIPFLYLYDSNHKEQNFISKELQILGLKNNISIENLQNLDLDDVKRKCIFDKQENQTNIAIGLISEML